MIWLLGAALLANVVAFFGVNYFDQSRMAWFALLAMVCACTAPRLNPVLTLDVAEAVVDLQVASAVDPELDTEVETSASISRYLFR